jgi:hypothetical protein
LRRVLYHGLMRRALPLDRTVESAVPATTMTPEQFIAKWQAADLKERAAAQSHFNDLCELLDEPKPTYPDLRELGFPCE